MRIPQGLILGCRIAMMPPTRLFMPSTQHEIPPVLWNRIREVRWLSLLFFCYVGICLFGGYISIGTALFLLLINTLLVAFKTRTEVNKIKDLVEDRSFLVCLHCGYSLNGSLEDGRCSECGCDYDLDSIRQAWISCLKNA